MPLALIADRICGIALRYGADVIDLRRVCTEDDDSVAEIEPFARGALRIAGAIAASLRDEESVGRTRTIAT